MMYQQKTCLEKANATVKSRVAHARPHVAYDPESKAVIT